MARVLDKSGGECPPGLVGHLEEFLPYAQEAMGYETQCSVVLVHDEENGAHLLGKTAYYDPEEGVVVVYVTNRHPKDIMRSVSHELVHHTQNERGDLEGVAASQGYAQEDPHMREMEREAYEVGNLTFRDWEDNKKSKINEVRRNIKWSALGRKL